MAFEEGNQYAKKGKLFSENLRKAIAQDEGKKVRAAIEKLLDLAAEGEPWAIQMLADRLDGRAAQSVELSAQVTIAERVSVLAAFLDAIPAGTADRIGEDVGEARPLLPASIPIAEERH